MHPHCPNCESKNVVIHERGEAASYCPDCSFTWWQSENIITVSPKVLEQLAGLKKTRGS